MDRRRAFGLGAVALMATAACRSTTEPESDGRGSRARTYASVEELAADSLVIAVGTVVRSTNLPGGSAVRAELEIAELPRPSMLGATYTGVTPEEPRVGDTLTVLEARPRQGDEVPDRFLEPGVDHLLFLVPTNLPAGSEYGPDAEAWWYVTGGGAGAYRHTNRDSYERMAPDDVDHLPDTLTPDEVQGLG